MTDRPLDHCWYAVATTDAVSDQPYPIEIRDVAFALWRDPDGAALASQSLSSAAAAAS